MNDPTHTTRVVGLGEGIAQAVCVCGWQSPRFGEEKRLGTMDALQAAREAGDLHEWDSAMGDNP
jgi:hypothetical protein